MGRYSKPVHKHDLILVGEKGEGGGEFKCGGCKEEEEEMIPGQVYYWCNLCKSHFHETCAKLPLQIKHFFHPCPLFLSYISTEISCTCCFGSSSDFTYHCERCKFDMCVECATKPLSIASDSDGEKILHCCHPHPLQPIPVEPKFLVSCRVCNMPCSLRLGPAWGCKQCQFQLHKSCLDFLPQIIQKKPRSKLGSWVLITRRGQTCTDCGEEISSRLVFRAPGRREICLCISCCLVRRLIDESSSSSSSSLVVSKDINHFFHPCHCLNLIFSPSAICNACFRSRHHQFSYNCDICDFFLCFDCAQPPQLLSHENEANQMVQHFCHWHPLKLFIDTKHTNHICSLCERICSEPFYSCNEQCQFYTHKSCMDSLPHRTKHRLISQPLALENIQSFECTTCNRQRSGLAFYCDNLNYNFCVKCVLWPENAHGNGGRFTSARHWHQLSLCETTKEHRASCFLCEECCIGQSYKCFECAFFFHKSCAELPTEVDHPIHPQHSLTLYRSSQYPYEDMTCKLCLQDLSQSSPLFDWVYRCHQCNFQLDIQCSSCLPSLEHKAHLHLLYVVVNMHGERICLACGESCSGYSTLHCADEECFFSLHLHCGPLPRTIKHPRHVHSLTLQDYYVEDNASDEFACHVCEEHRDPRQPVYCCSQDCFMICCVKCAASEVVPLLRGERGEAELISPYPRVPCRVINSKSVFPEMMMLACSSERDGADDGVQESKHVFSADDLYSLFGDEGFKGEENFSLEMLEEEGEGDKRDEKLTSENEQEDETSCVSEDPSIRRMNLKVDKEVESYSFSWNALTRFKNTLHVPSVDELDPYFLRRYEGSIMTGTFALPKTLSPIYEEFFGMYDIVDDNCKINYQQKRLLVLIMCHVLRQMRIIKVVDVNKKVILGWLGWIRYVQENGGFNIGFVAENIKQVWQAHYYIQSKKIVDEKSLKLREEVEQEAKRVEELRTKLAEAEARLEDVQRRENEHDTYRVVGSRGPMKKVRTDALEIKWRTCYESLVVLPGNAPAK